MIFNQSVTLNYIFILYYYIGIVLFADYRELKN